MIRLVQTCGACPEQYDAYIGTELVGYLRLRHGYFRVECPSSGGIEVYGAHPQGDGVFEHEERDGYLRRAVSAIHLFNDGTVVPPEDVEFEMGPELDSDPFPND